IDRQWALHEPIASSRRHSGFVVLLGSGMITKDSELPAIKLGNPTLDRHLPDRMPQEEPGDDTDLHRIIRSRRRGQGGFRISVGHDPAYESPVTGLEIPIVAALIGQVKWLV